MKVVILAGGKGTRISEESLYRPKPMIEIGGMPIIWHIMKSYSSYGFNEFIICAGYKQNVIKEWFANYFINRSDITFDFTSNDGIIVNQSKVEPWKVTIVDTGLETMTGGRVKRIKKYVGNEPFMLTYGDAVCDVDIASLIKFHNKNKKLATLTAVKLDQQKGVLDLAENNSVKSFREKRKNTRLNSCARGISSLSRGKTSLKQWLASSLRSFKRMLMAALWMDASQLSISMGSSSPSLESRWMSLPSSAASSKLKLVESRRRTTT